MQITDKLVRRGIHGEDIGVITPYNSQANLIHQAVSASVEIHTIDKYQVIFYRSHLIDEAIQESSMLYIDTIMLVHIGHKSYS